MIFPHSIFTPVLVNSEFVFQQYVKVGHYEVPCLHDWQVRLPFTNRTLSKTRMSVKSEMRD